MFNVKRMTEEDIPLAVQLADSMSWGLARTDFEFAMELEPEGCFILSDGSERIGLATNVSFGKVAWFGNLVVSKAHRGKGAGSLLVNHSIEYLKGKKVQTIGLYAYEERIPFYTRLGFEYDSDFSVLKGKGFSSPPTLDVRPALRPDMKKIIGYDHTCFGASRRKLLEPIMLDPDNFCLTYFEQGELSGYVVAKVYRGAAEVGPLGSPEDRSDVAIDLLKAALNKLRDLEVSVFVPKKESKVLSSLKANGFAEKLRMARMFHGPRPASSCTLMAESLERG